MTFEHKTAITQPRNRNAANCTCNSVAPLCIRLYVRCYPSLSPFFKVSTGPLGAWCMGHRYTDTAVGGWVSPCAVSPLVVCSPRGVWGLCPLRSSENALFAMNLSPHAKPTSGCSAPAPSWQSAAVRPGTTLSDSAPGRPPATIRHSAVKTVHGLCPRVDGRHIDHRSNGAQRCKESAAITLQLYR